MYFSLCLVLPVNTVTIINVVFTVTTAPTCLTLPTGIIGIKVILVFSLKDVWILIWREINVNDKKFKIATILSKS